MALGADQQILFITIEIVLLGLTLIAFAALGLGRLTSSLGIHRDGLSPGSIAPRWSLSDSTGQVWRTPTGNAWQLLVFVNHAIQSFPSVADGLSSLMREDSVEVIVVCRERADLTLAALDALGIEVPVIAVGEGFYARFRVRVMPFAYIIDPGGVVQAVGLVPAGDDVVTLWRRARFRTNLGPHVVGHTAQSTT